MARRVYMGADSIAGIPIENNDVNTDWEILLNLYATAYDSLDGIMLTNTQGVYDEATINEVKGRFLILYKLARKYAPEVKDEIKEIGNIVVNNLKNKISDKDALKRMRKILIKNGIPLDKIKEVEYMIDNAQFGAGINLNIKPMKFPKLFSGFTNKQKSKTGATSNLTSQIVPPVLPHNTLKPTKTKKKVNTKQKQMFDLNCNFFEIPKSNKVKKTKKQEWFNFNGFDLNFDFFGNSPKRKTKKRR